MRYSFADYVLDTSLFELRFKGALRPLQPKPLDLLQFLVRHRNRVVLKSELLTHLWPGVRVTENALAQAVACVREALADTPAPAIVSVRGRGYRFVLAVTERKAEEETRLGGSLAGREGGFVIDGRRPARLEGALHLLEASDAAVVRVAARGSAPLATFRAVVASYLEQHPDARLKSAPLAHLFAAADDEHALADLVTALFSEAPEGQTEGDGPSRQRPLAFVIENLERADLASLLLFALLAGMRREGLALLGTCAWDELAPDSAAIRILGPLAVPPLTQEASGPSSTSFAAPAFRRTESGTAPRPGENDGHLGTREIVALPRSAK